MTSAAPSPAADLLPISPAQSRFWYLDKLAPGRPEATITVRWELRGEVPSHIVEDAIHTIIGRHEVLRTRLIEHDGEPVQQVMDSVDFKLGQVDIRAVPIDDHEAQIDAIARQMAREPFDLSAPPLLRMTLVRTAPGRAIVLIAVHHCVFDGYSIGVLGHEMGLLAAAALAGQVPDLPALPLQYADYALWQRDCATSPARAVDTAYWARTLAGAPYFSLPGDGATPDAKQADPVPARIKLPLPPDFGTRIEAAARARGVSVFALGVAATTVALAAASGASEVSVATPVTGRDEVELEPLIGAFINTLVLRIPSPSGISHADHLDRAKHVVTQALTHQPCPLEDVLRAANPPRGQGRTPFTSVSFGMQRVFLREGSYGPLTLVSQPSHAPAIVYDVNINILGRDAGWHLLLDYNAARHPEAQMAALGQGVLDSLDRMIDAPDQLVTIPDRTPSNAPEQATATPPDRTLERLAGIWGDLLGLQPAECDGDFFALGGYSILALKMLAQAEVAFGQRVELARFLADPTLRGVAAQLDAARAASAQPIAQADAPTWSIIPLRDGSPDGPVIVTINQAFLYQRIAHRFAPRSTVINLTVPDKDALERQRSIGYERVLADAVTVLRAAFPGRAFVLVGHCIDGLNALGIAHGLHAHNVRILTIALLDSWAPPRPDAQVPRPLRTLRRLGGSLRRWRHYLGQWGRGDLGGTALLARNALGLRLLRATGAAPAPTDTERLMRDTNALHQVLARSRPIAPWEGDVLLFATQSQPRRATTRRFNWGPILPADAAVHQIVGWHEDALLHNGYDHLAAVIDTRISRTTAPQ